MRKTRRLNWKIKLVVFLAILVVSGTLLDGVLRPVIMEVARYQAQTYAVQSINESVQEVLAQGGGEYSSLIEVARDKDGNITSVESDMARMNVLKSRLAEAISARLEELQQEELSIPVGTLTGVPLLNGRGFGVPFRVIPGNYVNTAIRSEFSAAGVNQTLHSVYLDVELSVSAMVPAYRTAVDVHTDFLIAETVIVGEIPQVYLSSGVLAGDIQKWESQETAEKQKSLKNPCILMPSLIK